MKSDSRKLVKKGRGKLLKFGGGALFLIITLGLTHDIIITNILAYRICKADPNPKTFIKETVEYPESIYLEDNIYPGFDEKSRIRMIQTYLDGLHLKTMALNGPDGRIYQYTADEQDWKLSEEIKAQKHEGNYLNTLDTTAKSIANRGKIIVKTDLSRFNYKVSFNIISNTSFIRRYIYSDEIVINDSRENQTIGYNRRVLRRWYLLSPDIEVGKRYYYPKVRCGAPWLHGFETKIFSSINSHGVANSHGSDLNYVLFEKIVEFMEAR